MRLPVEAHTKHPWQIHRYADDLSVEDVWSLPLRGGPDDFPMVMRFLTSREVLEAATPLVVKVLLGLRWAIGGALGWDRPGRDDGSARIATRVPRELRETAATLETDIAPFEPLFLLSDEFAAETLNKTVHGVIHIGWVPDGEGRWRAQLAILVRRKGALGDLYMRAIAPFRHRIVYPALLGRLGKEWDRRQHLSVH